MGSLLVTVFLAVPLFAWLGGTLLHDDSLMKLARFSSARRGNFPISGKFYSPVTAARPVSHRIARRWVR